MSAASTPTATRPIAATIARWLNPEQTLGVALSNDGTKIAKLTRDADGRIVCHGYGDADPCKGFQFRGYCHHSAALEPAPSFPCVNCREPQCESARSYCPTCLAQLRAESERVAASHTLLDSTTAEIAATEAMIAETYASLFGTVAPESAPTCEHGTLLHSFCEQCQAAYDAEPCEVCGGPITDDVLIRFCSGRCRNLAAVANHTFAAGSATLITSGRPDPMGAFGYR